MKIVLTSELGETILGSEKVTIGRGKENTLAISDLTVSRYHAEIRPEGQGYSLIDLASTSGTFVNGQRLTPHTPRLLHSGDTIRLGNFTLKYEEQGLPSTVESFSAPSSTPDQPSTPSEPMAPSSLEPEWPIQMAPGSSSPIQAPQQQAGSLHAIEDLGDQDEVYQPPNSLDWEQPAQQPFWGAPQQGAPAANPIRMSPSTGILAGSPARDQPSHQRSGRSLNLAQEQLQFTAFHPGSAAVETWNTLLVYAYIESARQMIHADASRFQAQLGTDPSRADAWASRRMSRGTPITVVPTFRGVTFNPERITFTWVKDWHPAIFSFNPDRSWAGAVGNGEITFFAGPLIIASLKISLRFGEQGIQLQSYLDRQEVSALRYRKIFTSYSHSDTPIVLAIRRAYQALGDESFLDSENLRAGQNWNAALMRAIDSADIFQLFWSNHAAQSPYVYQECSYALTHARYDSFIRPVYWEKPMRNPPPELSHLHFAYYELPQPTPANKRRFSFFNIFQRKP